MEFPSLSSSRRRFLTRATNSYYDQLAGSPAAEYLQNRGIPGNGAKHYQLGYVGEPLEGHEIFQGHISIPYIAPAGVVAMRFRTLGEGPKYNQEHGTLSPLFNVRDLHRPDPHIAICEGEFDTMVMSGLCGVPAVGVPGVSHWEKNVDVWRRLFEDYERVYVVMDPDKAGQAAAKLIMRVVQDPMNIILPADVNDTYLTFGSEFIRNKMGLA